MSFKRPLNVAFCFDLQGSRQVRHWWGGRGRNYPSWGKRGVLLEEGNLNMYIVLVLSYEKAFLGVPVLDHVLYHWVLIDVVV